MSDQHIPDDPKTHLPKMNPTLKRKWIAALRSGKYRRTKAQLKNDRCYCCLGVLCVVAKQEFDPNESFLPVDLATLAQLDRDTQEVLTHLNDGECDEDEMNGLRVWRYVSGKGAPFSSIADFIEKHL